uniref:non-specific serine/threonine protein kinase n=1 Tax=Latimeria chalumnae TaxID=7897 RepID=H3BH09_LATCH
SDGIQGGEIMETVGKFEFSRKDLIGHGAFAVVFKGRHKEKQEWEVAVKCINKKNLAKSQTLLGKEIKILKELKHENIVALLDFQQERSWQVFLFPVYCNGGDLADYLHSKGTLSEDTIRLFLQQIAGAMKTLHSKGIIHRDLKPQNILLAYVGSKKSNPNNIRIKIGEEPSLLKIKTNMCGSSVCGNYTLVMTPKQTMQSCREGKASFPWTVVSQVSNTVYGTAPGQASSPQDLRLFYEKNKSLIPNIPRETSCHLRNLLLGLLQRNHKDRMEFDDFFHHSFLQVSSSMKKSGPSWLQTFFSMKTNTAAEPRLVRAITSPKSLAEMQQLREKTLTSPTQDSPGFLHGSKESAGSSSKNSSCDTDDFVIVPAQFPNDVTSEAGGVKPTQDSLMYSGSSLVTSVGLGSQGRTRSPSPSYSSSPSPSGRPVQFSASSHGQSVPIPVPTQIHNYQRIEQNLQSPSQNVSPRSVPIRRSSSTSPLSLGKTGASPPFHGEHGAVLACRRLSFGGSKPYLPSPQEGLLIYRTGHLKLAYSTGLEQKKGLASTLSGGSMSEIPSPLGLGSRLHSAPNLSDFNPSRRTIKKQNSDPIVTPYGQAHSSQLPFRHLRPSPKLSDFIHRNPLPTIMDSPTKLDGRKMHVRSAVTRISRNVSTLHEPNNKNWYETTVAQFSDRRKAICTIDGFWFRSLSTGKLSDLLLKAAFGGQISEGSSNDSLNAEKPMDIAGTVDSAPALHPPPCPHAPPPPLSFFFVLFSSIPSSACPSKPGCLVCFSAVGSSSSISSGGSCSGRRLGAGADALEAPFSLRYTFADAIATNLEGAVTFEAPELPEETLMEQEHTEILRTLRFMLAFVHCVMEIAAAKGSSSELGSSMSPSYQLQESVVADQISLLSKEWSYAEQLVLYMKIAELLSSALHTAMDQIKAGKLCLSSTVKQVFKRLNELYKSSVTSCRCLNVRLQRFFLDKQKLMDRINSITAEKLIYSHAVQMVQSAALDEMFHHGEDSIHRYQKALLLMEGLSQIIAEDRDIENISKCKLCIERRLSALQPGLCT